MGAVVRDGGSGGRGAAGGVRTEGLGDQGDAVEVGGGLDEAVDGVAVVLDVTLVGGDEDLFGGAGRLGEALGEDVQTGAGDGEGVVELAAGQHDGTTEHEDDEEPGGQHPDGVFGAPAAEPVQECGHPGSFHMSRRRGGNKFSTGTYSIHFCMKNSDGVSPLTTAAR